MCARYPEDFEQHRSDPPLRARRRSASNQSESASGTSGGLLSNVFSFVSREIGEFVVNATGGSEPSTSQTVAGPSRERHGGTRQTEKRHRRQSAPTQPSHDIRVPKRARTGKIDEDTTPSRAGDMVSHDEREIAIEGLRTSISPSPPSRRPRRGSISMPGSLFSRSPTPDSRTSPPDLHGRHVRFASDVISPVPRRRHPIAPSEVVEGEDEDEDEIVSQSDEDYDGGPSSSPEREDNSFYPSLPSNPRRISVQGLSSSEAPAPFRPPTIPSVKEVIAKLDGDSPPRLVRSTKPTWSTPAKGKAKNSGNSAPLPSVNKGKSKEVATPRLDSTSCLPSTAGSVESARRVDSFLRNKQIDLEADTVECSSRSTSKDDADKRRICELEDMVKSLQNEQLARSPRSTSKDDADKRRIRELEDMVKSLQNELARSRSSFPPPPPPPPPPPMSGSSTSRIPLSTPPHRGDVVDGVYASVRASLRQTSNPSVKSKVMPKNRLPTVPADKMEAFLNELKTVRLRKVGSGESLNRDSSRNNSQSSSQGNASLPEIGDKRKRVDSGNEAQVTSIRRRFNVPQPSASVPPSSVSGLSSKKSFLPPRHPYSAVNSRNSIPSLPELHGPTPSICSDNSNEIEERTPSTPPLRPAGNELEGFDADAANSTTSQPVEVPTLRERDREAEIHDPHIHEIPEKPLPARSTPQRMKVRRSPRTQSSQSTQETVRSANDDDDPFSRRLPTSPILPETPRRPRPPARVRSAAKPVPHPNSRNRSRSKSAPSNDVSDYDPLSMTLSLPNDESTPVPEPVGRRRRRLTLDDELRKADTSYSYSEEERAVAELESGELVGVGQKSKQLGFLAHGGAGGDPVLMGVGYVAGVVEESHTNDIDEQKKEGVKGRRGRSSAGGKRRPKR